MIGACFSAYVSSLEGGNTPPSIQETNDGIWETIQETRGKRASCSGAVSLAPFRSLDFLLEFPGIRPIDPQGFCNIARAVYPLVK